MNRGALWITRTEPGASALAIQLAEQGYNCITEPLLEIEPTDSEPPVSSYDLVFYLSGHAVQNAQCQPLGNLATFAVGDATARRLKEYDLSVEVPLTHSSEGLLTLSREYRDAKHALIVCGTPTRDFLARGLQDRGLHVDTYKVYQRIVRKINVGDLYQRSEVILIESLQCLQAIARSLLGTNTTNTVPKAIIVPSKRIADAARDLNLFRVTRSQGVKLEHMLEALNRVELCD